MPHASAKNFTVCVSATSVVPTTSQVPTVLAASAFNDATSLRDVARSLPGSGGVRVEWRPAATDRAG